MKTIKLGTYLTVFLFLFSVGYSHSVDIESVNSYLVMDHLLSLKEPGAPEILGDLVVFTASSGLRRVGIAFADEGFSKVHWFRPLWVSRDPHEIPLSEKRPNPYRDSGIAFYVHQIPRGAVEIEYRMIINGLWTTDPANPYIRRDRASGLTLSTLSIPLVQAMPNTLKGPPGGLSLVFNGPSGDTVTVAGSFNNWDPFMYELKEGPAGTYSLNIPLPPGRYQYVFFHRGRRLADIYNPNRVYSRDGNIASEIVIE